MINIPPGYILINDGPAQIAVKKEYQEALLALGINKPDLLLKQYSGDKTASTGRGIVPSIPVQDLPGTKIRIRKYLRGGLVRFINNDIFLGNLRPFNELYIGAEACLRKVPTAETLAAVSIKSRGPLFRGYLITKELTGCIDLPQYLKALLINSSDDFSEKKKMALAQTAETVRTMHDKGIFHADLNLKNILIHPLDTENIYIIDWDKSIIKNSLNDAERSSNIIRFCRSIVKFEQQGLSITEKDRKHFLNTYWKSAEKAAADLEKLNRIVRKRKVFWKIFQ